jgi:hypothetical protein
VHRNYLDESILDVSSNEESVAEERDYNIEGRKTIHDTVINYF